jgi:hypothetical protein
VIFIELIEFDTRNRQQRLPDGGFGVAIVEGHDSPDCLGSSTRMANVNPQRKGDTEGANVQLRIRAPFLTFIQSECKEYN